MARLFEQRDREREQWDELLSAYLDDELSAGERAHLEAQLATDQALQTELDALRYTVTLVRDLPPAPLPRNFILPQTMTARPQPAPLARPRRARLAPFLTAATAIVSLMFVVVLAGDLLLLSGTGRFASESANDWAMPEMAEIEAPLEAPASEPVAEQAAVLVTVEVEAEVVVEEAEEALDIEAVPQDTPLPMLAEIPSETEPTATSVAEGYAVGMSDGMSTTVPAAGGGGPTDETAPPPAPSASPAAELLAMPSPTIVEEADEAQTALPTAAARAQAVEGTPTLTPMEDAALPPQPVEEEAPRAMQIPPGEFGGEAEGEHNVPSTTIMPWRTLEIVLGLATLGLVIATVSAWRARRR